MGFWCFCFSSFRSCLRNGESTGLLTMAYLTTGPLLSCLGLSPENYGLIPDDPRAPANSTCQRPVKRNWCSKRDFFFNMERRWNETSISFHIIFFHINFYIFTLNPLGLVGPSSFFIQSPFGTISYSVVT